MMSEKKPTYEELEARLAEAESALNAIRNEQVDAMVGKKGVYFLRLKELEEKLRQSNQELTEYAYALTHNLKAPFRAIQNYAEFLAEDLADILHGESQQYLEGIKKAAIHANNQFKDLEALYNIKNYLVEFEPFDMRELLKEIQFMFKKAADREMIVAAHWPILNSCKSLLRQIFIDLVGNGFKYNHSEIKKVEVGWHQASDNQFEIFVRDNGIGIDSRYHARIFEIFRRLHTAGEYDGTGIGLAIASRAAQKMGGTFRVESALGKGSTFYVNLPNSIIENGNISNH